MVKGGGGGGARGRGVGGRGRGARARAHLGELDEGVDAGHHQVDRLVRLAVEAELAVRDVELEVLRRLLDFLGEVVELLVVAVAQRALPLLLLELVGVVPAAPRVVERLGGVHRLDVELDVRRLLLADHDRVAQVEVDDHEDLLLRRLEGRARGRRSGVRRRGERRDAEAGCGGGMWRRDVLGRDPSRAPGRRRA